MYNKNILMLLCMAISVYGPIKTDRGSIPNTCNVIKRKNAKKDALLAGLVKKESALTDNVQYNAGQIKKIYQDLVISMTEEISVRPALSVKFDQLLSNIDLWLANTCKISDIHYVEYQSIRNEVLREIFDESMFNKSADKKPNMKSR